MTPQILGNQAQIAAVLADYEGDMATLIHDECAECEVCGNIWFRPDRAHFDHDIWNAEGVRVCEECAPEYIANAIAELLV